MPQFEGKFKVDMSRLEVDSVPLQDNFVYDIVTLNTVATDGSNKVYLLEVVRELGGKKPLVGDMNNDGVVDVTDTSILINGVLDKSSANLRVDRADINGDTASWHSDLTLTSLSDSKLPLPFIRIRQSKRCSDFCIRIRRSS